MEIRIGTRESSLAMWQAGEVSRRLTAIGLHTTIVPIRSEGDADKVTPLYEMGVEGVFTRTLDMALLSGSIDMAVHSMKDVPVVLARGLQQAAVLERGSPQDLLVYKGKLEEWPEKAIVASCSIRRMAQWLYRYPQHHMVPLRGNVDSRLRQFEREQWNGAIFAAAGLERIGMLPTSSMDLHWMLPAPAQGAIMVVARAHDTGLLEILTGISHQPTEVCVKAERDFLRALHGGCSAPIGALATVAGDEIRFSGNICSPDGRDLLQIEESYPLESTDIGARAASLILEDGATWIQKIIRR